MRDGFAMYVLGLKAYSRTKKNNRAEMIVLVVREGSLRVKGNPSGILIPLKPSELPGRAVQHQSILNKLIAKKYSIEVISTVPLDNTRTRVTLAQLTLLL
jgi:hypothetical protein